MSAIPDKEFNDLEGHLAATLKPIRPGHAFVQNVRQRIAATGPAVGVRRAADPQAFLLMLTGLISAFILAAAFARLLFFFLSRSK